MNIRQKIGHKVIGTARKSFAGTKVQEWKITSTIYMKVFDMMYGKKNVKATFRGSVFTLPTKDISLTPSVLAGHFEKNELDIFERACKTGHTVIDVGANIGLYSVIAAKKVGQMGKVLAFEPVPENLELLQSNIKANKIEKIVRVTQSAVGQEDGELEIFLSDRQVGTHSAARKDQNSSSLSVPMLKIDTYVKENKVAHVDVVKIDVEGYDGQVLEGAITTLKKFRPILFIEYSPLLLQACGQDPYEFIDTLLGIYDKCILVDEFKGVTRQVTKNDLLNLKIVTNVNLVLLDSRERSITELLGVKV